MVSALVAGGAIAALPPQVSVAQADPQEILWGARVGRQADQSDLGALDDMETAVGRPFDVVRIFTSWERNWPDSYANRLAAEGQIPLLSVKPKRENGSVITWASIADAPLGSSLYRQIEGWATKVKNFPGPVYFTFHHEAEATVNLPYGTDAEFIAAWRRVVDVFRAEGVTNAKYLFIATDFSFWIPLTERRAAAKWYPGDPWVDAIGADAYNWANCRDRNEGWRSLQQLIEPLRQFGLAHPTKELWLPEFGTVEDAGDPQRKANWLRDAAALFKQPGWEQFRGVSYFHFLVSGFPKCEWWINSSPASLEAFAEMGADPFYGGEVPPAALFVVADPAALTAGETLAATRLDGDDVEVTFADDGIVTAADAAAYDVVLLSSSVSSSLTTRFRDVPTPVVVWKPWIYDDMRLTGTVANTDYTTVSRGVIDIVEAGDPFAAGKTGSVTVSGSQPVAAGTPSAAGEVIASVDGRPALFVYRPGAAMVGGFTAPACRVAFPTGNAAMAAMTEDGWDLFLTAVRRAAENCV
jgi:hypothetical protein